MLAQGRSQAAQLQIDAAARKHQKLGAGLQRAKDHEHIVVRAETLQSRRLRMLSLVTDIGGEYAGDGRVKEAVWDALSHRVAEVQRFALPADERDVKNAVLRRAQAELPHELGQMVSRDDVSGSDLPSQHKEADVGKRAVKV